MRCPEIMRILITGASGLVGRHLCPALAQQGHQVHALTRPGSDLDEHRHPLIQCFPGNLTVPESVAPAVADCDTVIHAGSVKQASREVTFSRVNVDGTARLADLSAQAGVTRFIYVSSIAAQGPSPSDQPHESCGQEDPQDQYGKSLLAAETLLREHSLAPNCTVLRPALLYGPHDQDMLNWIRLASRRVLPVRSNFLLSMLHVSDLTRLVQHLLVHEPVGFGPYFVSESQPILMEQLTDLLERTLDRGPTLRLYLKDGFMSRVAAGLAGFNKTSGVLSGVSKLAGDLNAEGWACDPSALFERINFAPEQNIESAMPDTIRWYERRGLL